MVGGGGGGGFVMVLLLFLVMMAISFTAMMMTRSWRLVFAATVVRSVGLFFIMV